jgi:hypothetical protein
MSFVVLIHCGAHTHKWRNPLTRIVQAVVGLPHFFNKLISEITPPVPTVNSIPLA